MKNNNSEWQTVWHTLLLTTFLNVVNFSHNSHLSPPLPPISMLPGAGVVLGREGGTFM